MFEMKEVHIFDMDDTLLTTPTFADMIRDTNHKGVEEFLNHVKEGFLLFMYKEVDFKVLGDFIVMTDTKGVPLSSSYLDLFEDKLVRSETEIPKPETFSKQVGMKRSSLRDILKCLGDKDKHIVILQIRGFHADPNTIGLSVNSEVIDAYMNASHKMIVTGRAEALKPAITSRLAELGLHFPDQGLYCFNGSGSIQNFKVMTILDSIQNNGWNRVHFYEDRNDWLNAGAEAVSAKFPHVEFVKHHITNVHDAKTL